MMKVVQKTVEEEVLRADWCLRVTDANADSVLVEYMPDANNWPERTLHKEAFHRAMKVLAARGWNPAACTFEVMGRATDNSPQALEWWETAAAYSFAEAVDVVSGKAALTLTPPAEEPEMEFDATGQTVGESGPPPAERAGRKSLDDDERALLSAIFGEV